MAGDWLKIEVCTPDKPEVIGISDILGMCPAHTFGCLFLVWRWFDQHTTTGNASYVTKVTVDRLSGNDGFADAMVKVGWLEINDDGSVTLPHFDTHNGETAKQRGLTAKRVAKSKAKSNATTVTKSLPDALPREEKRREENINTLVHSGAGRTCPHEEILGLYHENLPTLASVKVWSDKRRKLLQARWREDEKRQSLEWWRRFFQYVAQSDFLLGKSGQWQADLEWLLNSSNFVKVIEGKYENRKAT